MSSTFCFQRQGAGGHLASYTTASLGHSLPPRLAYTQVGHLQMHAKKELDGEIFFYTKNAKPNCNGCHRGPQPPPSWQPLNKLLLQPLLLLRRQGDNSLATHMVHHEYVYLYIDMVHHTCICLLHISIPYSSYLHTSIADIMVAQCTEEKDKKARDSQMFKVHKCSFSKIYLSKCPQNCFGQK